ncbi:hypothetical protein [Streptomyces sp. SID2119]|uniref:hypothetical protein n=1 Tax=Streptomyces sp. SID2119 TaxID=2690253 RepID=UPI001F2AF1A0|nr:hypothetical protein [Streptomyces sp. SID2119]
MWDRCNGEEGKGVDVGPLGIPDGQMADLHRVGPAQEFDMARGSFVRPTGHMELDIPATARSPQAAYEVTSRFDTGILTSR